MVFEYCPKCGTKSTQKSIGDEGSIAYCDICKKPLFPFVYSCILTHMIDEEGNFALIQQDNVTGDVYIGVSGYLKPGDTLESAVRREVLEEIGLEVKSSVYVKSYFMENKDLLMLGFVSFVKRAEFHLSGEVRKARWFSAEDARKALPEGSIILRLFDDFADGKRQGPIG